MSFRSVEISQKSCSDRRWLWDRELTRNRCLCLRLAVGIALHRASYNRRTCCRTFRHHSRTCSRSAKVSDSPADYCRLSLCDKNADQPPVHRRANGCCHVAPVEPHRWTKASEAVTVEPRDACPHPYSQCEHRCLKHSQVAARCSAVRHGTGTLSIRTATAHLDCFNGTTTCPVRSMNSDRRIRCSAIGLPKCTGIRTTPRDGRNCISSGITVPSTLALNRPFCAKALRCRSGNGPFRPFATGVSTNQAKLPQSSPFPIALTSN